MADTGNLSADKRERILQAALDEFAEKGYRAASTNSIASRAGVAKGLIFHYYGSKKELYLAIYQWLTDEVFAELDAALNDAPADLFERFFVLSERKLAMFQNSPKRTRFGLTLYTAPEEIRLLVGERAAKSAQQGVLARLLAGADISRLRPGVSPEEAMDAISTISAGLQQVVISMFRQRTPDGDEDIDGDIDLTPIFARSRRLLTLLRDGLYRDGGRD